MLLDSLLMFYLKYLFLKLGARRQTLVIICPINNTLSSAKLLLNASFMLGFV